MTRALLEKREYCDDKVNNSNIFDAECQTVFLKWVIKDLLSHYNMKFQCIPEEEIPFLNNLYKTTIEEAPEVDLKFFKVFPDTTLKLHSLLSLKFDAVTDEKLFEIAKILESTMIQNSFIDLSHHSTVMHK